MGRQTVNKPRIKQVISDSGKSTEQLSSLLRNPEGSQLPAKLSLNSLLVICPRETPGSVSVNQKVPTLCVSSALSWQGGPGHGLHLSEVAWLSSPLSERPRDCRLVSDLFPLQHQRPRCREYSILLYIFGIWTFESVHSSVPPKMSKLMLYARDNETF